MGLNNVFDDGKPQPRTARLARTGLVHTVKALEDAAQVFTGKKGEAKTAPSDVDQLKAELAALQAKVDRLSR